MLLHQSAVCVCCCYRLLLPHGALCSCVRCMLLLLLYHSVVCSCSSCMPLLHRSASCRSSVCMLLLLQHSASCSAQVACCWCCTKSYIYPLVAVTTSFKVSRGGGCCCRLHWLHYTISPWCCYTMLLPTLFVGFIKLLQCGCGN